MLPPHGGKNVTEGERAASDWASRSWNNADASSSSVAIETSDKPTGTPPPEIAEELARIRANSKARRRTPPSKSKGVASRVEITEERRKALEHQNAERRAKALRGRA